MHYKQNNKESKNYLQGLRPLGSTLPRGIKGLLKKNGYNYSEIIGKWNILVGREISSCCYPKSIKMVKGNDDGTLILAVKRGDEITVEYAKKEIMSKINSYFGYKFIREIKLQAFNIQSKKIKNKNLKEKFSVNFKKRVNEIKNKDIRDSLSKLIDVVK